MNQIQYVLRTIGIPDTSIAGSQTVHNGFRTRTLKDNRWVATYMTKKDRCDNKHKYIL